MPSTCTGIGGPADLTVLPRSSSSARNAPGVHADDEVVADLERATLHEDRGDGTLSSVELCFDDGTRGALVRVRLEVEQLGLQENCSSSVSMFVPFLAEISVLSVVPPNSSSTTPCCRRSCLTFIGFACGRSTLLMATIIGTPAFLACEIARSSAA
jgi:hypothetical protein